MSKPFLERVSSRVRELNSLNRTTMFTISVTGKAEANPFLTPIRAVEEFALSGCVLFDRSTLNGILDILDGSVDFILADCEKKIPMGRHAHNRAQSENDLCTIADSCAKQIRSSELYEIKPTDITVSSAWSFLSQRTGSLNGKKVCIFGAGNIGGKLALKLAESGSNVTISRRSTNVSAATARSMNALLPDANYPIRACSDYLEAASSSDVLVGASSGGPIITSQMIKLVSPECSVVDLGKDNLTQDAIEAATFRNISLYRTDITPGLEAFAHELLKTRNMLQKSCGRKDLGFCFIVAGGFLGSRGDIVVDSIAEPRLIIGVAEGNGLIKQELDSEDLRNIETLKKNVLQRI